MHLHSWPEQLGTYNGLWCCSHVKSLAKGERTFTFCGSNVQWMAPEILKGTGVHQGRLASSLFSTRQCLCTHWPPLKPAHTCCIVPSADMTFGLMSRRKTNSRLWLYHCALLRAAP